MMGLSMWNHNLYSKKFPAGTYYRGSSSSAEKWEQEKSALEEIRTRGGLCKFLQNMSDFQIWHSFRKLRLFCIEITLTIFF